ncbi:hypothetical protein P154DRAFT_573809 [Amniculicola lignicola CBS 123094]|uniref:C2H2-type domain-containing protein n=1 Tax=Amniculicola lignicola CBS 123094 TaxID=1392246 RepID=A0A6A5WNL5_9PLEO|nr:hypothetical protein P154DRAFT_573809 [Amniculicola lignicola CBS 123094]
MSEHVPGGFPPQTLDNVQENNAFTAYLAMQQTPHLQYAYNNHTSTQQTISDNHSSYPSGWPDTHFQPRRQHTRHESHPWSTRSSNSSRSRDSNNSTFSHYHYRDSVAPRNTSISYTPEPSRDSHIFNTQQLLDGHSGLEALQRAGPQGAPPPGPTHSRNPSLSGSAKPMIPTCVSRTKRTRRTDKTPRYWCTACEGSFGEKYDWKRHEETYQERSEMYQCPNCKKAYFLDKEFVDHHQKSHKCQTCTEQRHVDQVRRRLKGRTHWGCGFCPRLDTDWTERCNHVASHFEKGNTIEDWKHSQVILSLLQQPLIRDEWMRLIRSKQEAKPRFGWSKHTTGRAEGYPYNDCAPQLQDLLEYFTPDQDAQSIVELAYNRGHVPNTKGHKHSPVEQKAQWTAGPAHHQTSPKSTRALPTYATAHNVATASSQLQWSQSNSPSDKPLPSPPKPQMDGFADWSQFGNTIIDDPLLPNNSFLADMEGMGHGTINFPFGAHMGTF